MQTRPAREQVLNYRGRLNTIRQEIRQGGGDPGVTMVDGVLTVGGADGIVIGSIDAAGYIEPKERPETGGGAAPPLSAPTSTATPAVAATGGGSASGGSAISVDEYAPADHTVCDNFSCVLHQTNLGQVLSPHNT